MLGEYDVPIMYQDLGNYMPSPMMGGMMPGMMPMYPSYLGDVHMQQLPERDMVQLANKKDNQGKKTAKLLAKIIGAALLIGYIPYFRKQITNAGGIGKYCKNNWTKLIDAIKKIR
jgi:hypothetical protein